MSRRDLLFSAVGHAIFGFLLLFLTPLSAGLWGREKPPPLMIPVTLVGPPPRMRAAARPQPPPVSIPKPAPDDRSAVKPAEKLSKEKLAQKAKPDSTQTGKQVSQRKDTTKVLAAKDTPGRTGDLSHTIIDGAGEEGQDDIFGEYVPAVGPGATDPYFQSLFLAVQRAFRNPVPGYKSVRCVVTFTLMKNGAIKDIKLETSSAIPRFDRAAMAAIESIEWGQPFPAQYGDFDGYHIRMPFEYVPR